MLLTLAHLYTLGFLKTYVCLFCGIIILTAGDKAPVKHLNTDMFEYRNVRGAKEILLLSIGWFKIWAGL